jgi:4-phosphopantoate--beta-alanine ligase
VVKIEVPRDHPRYESLAIREKIIEGMHDKIVAEAGLIAHGRGEAFDYILGEKTPEFALKQEELAVITLLLSNRPIISVNGNVAILCPIDIIKLSKELNAPLEINLFYRTRDRELAISKILKKAGAKIIFGIEKQYQTTIPEISHQRRIVDSRGIAISDCVFVPLEDGDRAHALRQMGKEIVTVDLNPLSRTSLAASVSITNNIIRAVREMVSFTDKWKGKSRKELELAKSEFNNVKLLQEALKFMSRRLNQLSTNNDFFNTDLG